jgi:hypothetical protein
MVPHVARSTAAAISGSNSTSYAKKESDVTKEAGNDGASQIPTKDGPPERTTRYIKVMLRLEGSLFKLYSWYNVKIPSLYVCSAAISINRLRGMGRWRGLYDMVGVLNYCPVKMLYCRSILYTTN